MSFLFLNDEIAVGQYLFKTCILLISVHVSAANTLIPLQHCNNMQKLLVHFLFVILETNYSNVTVSLSTPFAI